MWPTFLRCIQDSPYYFSVDELSVIAWRANINVAFFKQIGQQLEFAGGYFENASPTGYAKLNANNQGRVRSHFERLIPIEDIEALREEGRTLAREQAAMEREEQIVKIFEKEIAREQISMERQDQDAQAAVLNKKYAQDTLGAKKSVDVLGDEIDILIATREKALDAERALQHEERLQETASLINSRSSTVDITDAVLEEWEKARHAALTEQYLKTASAKSLKSDENGNEK